MDSCCIIKDERILCQKFVLPANNQPWNEIPGIITLPRLEQKGNEMHLNLKALLLSALVVPGLGQLYKGEKIKGAIIICLVNIFLLAALFMVLQGAGHLLAVNASMRTDPATIIAELKEKSPTARWLLAAFCGIWIYGAADAARGNTRNRKTL